MIPVALSIAGSDPSGGAGIQADLKTFHQFGVYGEAVITLLTVQNTRRVDRVEIMLADLVIEQLRAVLDDVPPAAAKTGALGDATIIEAVGSEAEHFNFPLVVDPVMISKHGAPLMTERGRELVSKCLVPGCALITPNLHEAAALTGRRVESLSEMRDAAASLAGMGAQAVLVKGGHLSGSEALDVLYADGTFTEFRGERIDTPNTHGTGCVYSAAITAGLAQGHSLIEAVGTAKRFISEAIRTSPGLGGGSGPINLFVAPRG